MVQPGVGNNPANLVDPSGHIAPIVLAIGVGAAIGGVGGGVGYALAHPGGRPEDYLRDAGFRRAVGVGALSGAVGGGLAGGVGEAVRQVATYGHIHNPQLLGAAMLSGVVSGGVLGAVGYGIRQLLANRIQAITPPTNRAGLRDAMPPHPPGMANPQAHHDLPWNFRGWFAGPRRGLNVNNPRFSQWVEGAPPGPHQNWHAEYNAAWQTFIENNPAADRWQVMAFLRQLLSSGRFPSR